MKKYLVSIFIVAFLLRLISLNQSIWLDEGTTARVVSQYTFSQIITSFSPFDFHPPLYYLFIKLWSSIFGNSEISLRLPSVLASLGAGWFVYLAAKRLKNENVGVWAAAFFLVNPLIVYYSQEARMYLIATLFLSAALFYFINLINTVKPNIKDVVLFNSAIFLSFMTFYGSVFFIAAFYLYYFWKRRFRVVWLLPGFITALLIIFPLLYEQIIHAKSSLGSVANWSAVLGKVTLKNAALIPLKFSIGRISFEPKILYYALSCIWTVVVFVFFAFGVLKNKVLLSLFLLPLVIGTIFSFLSPLLQYFRFIYLIIPLSIGLALGTTKNWQRMIILSGFIIFTFAYLIIPQFHREDWKSLSKEFLKQQVVYGVPSSLDALRYYKKDLIIKDLRSDLLNQKEVIIIPYTTDIYGFDYKTKLIKDGYHLSKKKNYRNLSEEIWSTR